MYYYYNIYIYITIVITIYYYYYYILLLQYYRSSCWRYLSLPHRLAGGEELRLWETISVETFATKSKIFS